MILSVLAIALLTAAVIACVAAPLFGSPAPPPGTSLDRERMELAARQASLYATLKELDFDLAAGRITPEDHELLKGRYTAEAVEILEKLDALAPGGWDGARR